MTDGRKVRSTRAAVLVPRFAWSCLGAYLGVMAFFPVCTVFPGVYPWLDQHAIDLGGGTLPLAAFAWIAFGVAGAALFGRVWSVLATRVGA